MATESELLTKMTQMLRGLGEWPITFTPIADEPLIRGHVVHMETSIVLDIEALMATVEPGVILRSRLIAAYKALRTKATERIAELIADGKENARG